MNMCIYHVIVKSNTLPVDDKETPSTVNLVLVRTVKNNYFLLCTN